MKEAKSYENIFCYFRSYYLHTVVIYIGTHDIWGTDYNINCVCLDCNSDYRNRVDCEMLQKVEGRGLVETRALSFSSANFAMYIMEESTHI